MSSFSDCRNTIFEEATALKTLLSEEEQKDVERNVLEALEQNRFEVAVIGQMKAGKSTFLNVMIDRLEFLPTNPTPWTAVLTRLHFGEPDGPRQGARFTFYSHEEWADLVAMVRGDQRDKKQSFRSYLKSVFGTAEDDEDDEKVCEELERIVDRVERRFGARLQSLLGSFHRHDDIDQETLEAYLASGESADDKPHAGKYTDIVREADLYLELPPFKEPSTIVDTPGTNDPNRNREKITIDYVGRAHAYILLLNAQQAWNAHEEDLVANLVQGLHKDRLVVFLNRIDGMGNPAKEIAQVERRVRSALEKLFPEIQIPIVSGCAIWAEKALEMDRQKVDEETIREVLYESTWANYAVEHGFITKEQLGQWRKDVSSVSPETIKELLMETSGVPAARRIIEDRLLAESGLVVLRDALNGLGVAAKSFAKRRVEDAKLHEENAKTLEAGKEAIEKSLAKAKKRQKDVKDKMTSLRNARDSATEDLRNVVLDQVSELADDLDGVVIEFANKRADSFRRDGIPWFSGSRSVTLETAGSQLEGAFTRRYRKATDKVERQQSKFRGKIREQLNEVDESLAYAIDLVPIAATDPKPSIASLRDTATVDFPGLWKRVRSTHTDRDEKADELKVTITAELSKVVEGLSQSAKTGLSTPVESMVTKCETTIDIAIKGLERDLEKVMSWYKQRKKEQDPENTKKEIEQQKKIAEELRQAQAKLKEFASGLKHVQLPDVARREPEPVGATED